VERWKGGKVEGWKGGKVERWKGGKVEGWKCGKVEKWKGGRVEPHYRGKGSNVPLFHYSTSNNFYLNFFTTSFKEIPKIFSVILLNSGTFPVK
jgi:hypothetical protein